MDRHSCSRRRAPRYPGFGYRMPGDFVYTRDIGNGWSFGIRAFNKPSLGEIPYPGKIIDANDHPPISFIIQWKIP